MPNIASVLKSDIARVARKEVRCEIDSLRKASTVYRSEIAALKRRTQSLEQELRRIGKALPKPAAKPVRSVRRHDPLQCKGLRDLAPKAWPVC